MDKSGRKKFIGAWQKKVSGKIRNGWYHDVANQF